jgi:Epoxide hydrolase N terminus
MRIVWREIVQYRRCGADCIEMGASMIKPFRINVSDDVLADLKARLQRTRWPDAELVNDWSQGAPLRWIQDICQYWANTYDWRAREAQLNRFDQFTSEIDGLGIHFLHVRSKDPTALPLIITHGWPGSIVESRTYGSVRGAGSNLRPYRDRVGRCSKSSAIWGTPVVVLTHSRR